MRFYNRKLTKNEYLERKLEKALRRSSHGKIPKTERITLAKRTIGRMDLTNPYQMHKSLQGYADILAHNYLAK